MKDILNGTTLNSRAFPHVMNTNKTYLVVFSNECDQRGGRNSDPCTKTPNQEQSAQ